MNISIFPKNVIGIYISTCVFSSYENEGEEMDITETAKSRKEGRIFSACVSAKKGANFQMGSGHGIYTRW